MSIISPKSSLSQTRQSRGKLSEVCGEKDLYKRGFEPTVKKREGVKKGINDDVHELPWVKCAAVSVKEADEKWQEISLNPIFHNGKKWKSDPESTRETGSTPKINHF